ncbi:MAG: hypothetical protein Q8P18_21775 [Pseudomonadota bacterium]|nr:hypothetical protein [Pseudomonadota bacterium]
MPWLLLLFACREPVIEVIPGVSTALEVVVTNPTSCPACDAFRDVDTLRLDISMGDVVVASDTFAYPDEAVTLPDLADFGVIRITLLGLAEGRVLSAGRTAEIVLVPDAELSVPLVFLPVNRALALDAPMLTDRSRHVALTRRDGSVVLIGGVDPQGERATATTERFDPTLGTFAEFSAYASPAVASPVAAVLDGGDTLLVGGYALLAGATVAVENASVFDDTLGTFSAIGSLSQGRNGHCVAMFRERQGIVLGGSAADSGGGADYLKPDGESGEWGFIPLEMRDFDAAAVTGCAVLTDGSVYVQGSDAASTGVWDGGDTELDPAEAFFPMNEGNAGDFRYVSGGALFPTDDGSIRILGGADVGTGAVYADGRLYAPDAKRFVSVEGFGEPRFAPQIAPWITPGWYAAGCGWTDSTRTAGEATIELVSPVEGMSGPAIQLDRARPGCGLSVLLDGSILVTGGYEVGNTAVLDAALVVPYVDPAMGG